MFDFGLVIFDGEKTEGTHVQGPGQPGRFLSCQSKVANRKSKTLNPRHPPPVRSGLPLETARILPHPWVLVNTADTHHAEPKDRS
jgi:hypothetical protein